MVLHPLDITFDLFLRYPQQQKETGQNPMPVTDGLGDGLPLRSQDKTTVTLPQNKPLGIEPLDHVGHTGLRDPKAGRYVHDASVPLRFDEFMDPLEIIFGGG